MNKLLVRGMRLVIVRDRYSLYHACTLYATCWYRTTVDVLEQGPGKQPPLPKPKPTLSEWSVVECEYHVVSEENLPHAKPLLFCSLCHHVTESQPSSFLTYNNFSYKRGCMDELAYFFSFLFCYPLNAISIFWYTHTLTLCVCLFHSFERFVHVLVS